MAEQMTEKQKAFLNELIEVQRNAAAGDRNLKGEAVVQEFWSRVSIPTAGLTKTQASRAIAALKPPQAPNGKYAPDAFDTFESACQAAAGQTNGLEIFQDAMAYLREIMAQ